MPKQEYLEIISNHHLTYNVFELKLKLGEYIPCPGQFIEIAIPNFTLRRPFSVSQVLNQEMSIVYKVIGEGTKQLSNMKAGVLDVLVGCGNGVNLENFGEEMLIVAGGLGTAIMPYVILACLQNRKKIKVLFGFAKPEDALFQDELENHSVEVVYTYDSEGENVIQKMIRLGLDTMPYIACGPLPMLKALVQKNHAYGQVSLEARMGCGFGACMGCSIELKDRMARVCKEGPIFEAQEVKWEALQ